MENTLKLLREKAGLTQEVVADRLEMTVGTIQNWERTGKIQKEQLHNLLDLYGVGAAERNRVVLDIFGDDRREEEKPAVESDNFPYFLFDDRPDIVAAAKRAELSVEEMELFGYTYYLEYFIDTCGEYHEHRTSIDYRVFEKYGGYFRTMCTINQIKLKIGEYKWRRKDDIPSLATFVYNFGLCYPNVPFKFCALSKQDIANNVNDLPGIEKDRIYINKLYAKCKAVEKPIFLGTSEHYERDDNIPEIVRGLYRRDGGSYYHKKNDNSYRMYADGVIEKCIVIVKRENTEEGYLNRRNQYLSDKEAYDAHPNLFDRAPEFEYQYDFYIRLTDLGREYIQWYEK